MRLVFFEIGEEVEVPMAIDVKSEKLVPIDNGHTLYPIRPSKGTVRRHAQRGCRGVLLETVLVGGKRYTSQSAVDRFLASLNSRSA